MEKHCIACKETIHPHASRCRQCGELQGWQRFIGFPTSVVALVLSLLSIATTKPVERLFDPERAELQISITGGDYNAAQLMLVNNGTKPATLEAFEITSKATGNAKTWFLASNTDGEIIEPGKFYKIKATNDTLIPKVIDAERRVILKSQYAFRDNCELSVKYIEATGQKVVRVQPFLCDTPPERGGLHPSKPGIPLQYLGQE
ncbi:hypothetical protein [Pseudomonas jessenii]|uniref:hypothetical protein n=1 Tax=Pseudomonas jessenii TaxID=77298 RepID=UPI0032E49CC1